MCDKKKSKTLSSKNKCLCAIVLVHVDLLLYFYVNYATKNAKYWVGITLRIYGNEVTFKTVG